VDGNLAARIVAIDKDEESIGQADPDLHPNRSALSPQLYKRLQRSVSEYDIL